MAEGRQPDALLRGELRLVVEEAVVEPAGRVRQADDRGVLRQGDGRLLAEAVGEERLAGGETQADGPAEVVERRDGREGAVGAEAPVGKRARRDDVVETQVGVDREARQPFPLIAELETGDVLQRLRLEVGHQEVVPVEEREALARGLDVVAGRDREIVAQRLEGMEFLGLEAVDEGQFALDLAVAEAVGHVAVQEILLVEVGRGHAAETDAESFVRVVVEHVGDRTDVELALGAVLRVGQVVHRRGREILGGQRLDGVGDAAETRDGVDVRHQAVQDGFLAREGHGTALVPPGVRTPPVRVGQDLVGLAQQAVGDVGLREVVAVVDDLLVCIELPHPLEDVEAGVGVLLLGGPGAVFGLLVGLLDRQVADEVEVDVGRDAQGVFLDGVGAVVDDVEVSGEAEAFAVERHESQVDALDPVHLEGVGDVVLVVGRGQRAGERADEAVEQHLHVVVVDVGVREDGADVGAEAAGVQRLVEAEAAAALHPRARALGIALEPGRGKVFAQRDGQHGRLLELRRVHVFLQEAELVPEAAAVEVDVEAVERHDQLLVVVHLVARRGLDAVLVLVGDDVADQLHGGVAAAAVHAVAAALGLHDHGLDAVGVGLHLDVRVAGRRSGTDVEDVGFITQHLETDIGIGPGAFDGEGAFGVGHRADLRAGENDRDIGERLTRFGIRHDALDSGLGDGTDRRQKQHSYKCDSFHQKRFCRGIRWKSLQKYEKSGNFPLFSINFQLFTAFSAKRASR